MGGKVERAIVGVLGRLVLVVEYGGGKEAEVLDDARYLDVRRQTERLALIARLGLGELVDARLDLVGDAIEQLSAATHARHRPGLEGEQGRLHGHVGLGLAAVRHYVQQLAIARIEALDALLGRHEHVVDEVRELNGLVQFAAARQKHSVPCVFLLFNFVFSDLSSMNDTRKNMKYEIR